MQVPTIQHTLLYSPLYPSPAVGRGLVAAFWAWRCANMRVALGAALHLHVAAAARAICSITTIFPTRVRFHL